MVGNDPIGAFLTSKVFIALYSLAANGGAEVSGSEDKAMWTENRHFGKAAQSNPKRSKSTYLTKN